MRIYVRLFEGKEIILDVQSTDTIQNVKKQIQLKERIRIDLQRLMLGDKILENWRTLIYYQINDEAVIYLVLRSPEHSTTIAGGWGKGAANDELCYPYGLTVDTDQTIIIADWGNHRVLQWKLGSNHGEVVAGGQDPGVELNQLNSPTDVIIDHESNSLFICDRGNHRVVRWSREEGTTEGEAIISNVNCWGLAMDNERNIYISDTDKHQVLRYRLGNPYGTVVAGGRGRGMALDQLNYPTYLFIDDQKTVYVADVKNNRVIRWEQGASKGSIVAKGFPRGIFVDHAENVYVADYGNHRLMYWGKGATVGKVIPEGDSDRDESNESYYPWGISYDQQGHLYITDHSSHRIQRLSLKSS